MVAESVLIQIQHLQKLFRDNKLQILLLNIPYTDSEKLILAELKIAFPPPAKSFASTPDKEGNLYIAICCSAIKVRQIDSNASCIKLGVFQQHMWNWIMSVPSTYATNPDYHPLLTQTANKLWNTCTEWVWNFPFTHSTYKTVT